MSDYTVTGVYVVITDPKNIPDGIKLPEPGEARNHGKTADGRTWFKNGFASPEELITYVHAMDAGLLELKNLEQMRALMPKEKETTEVIR
jgi:hypothetical protein